MNTLKTLIAFICLITISGCSADKTTSSENKVKSLVITSSSIIDGKSRQMTVIALPSNATDKTVTWSVSDTSIAIISESGLLSAVSNGTVIVKAITNDGSEISAESSVTISGVQGPTVFVTNLTVIGTNITDGKPQQLSLNVLPADATNKVVSWEVSNTEIATISSSGLLTPKSNGTIAITTRATDGSGKINYLEITISGVIVVYPTKVRSESILVWQRNNGGWGKAVPDLNSYNTAQTSTEIATALSQKNYIDTTIDNGHVTTELRWLLADYKSTNNPNYLAAAEKAIDYLFLAQYANGGWPQYYPDKSLYRHQITYNDDAIVKVMNVMWDISKKQKDMEIVDSKYIAMATTSFNKGIDIILKTQVTINGKKTAWCAQHDEITLLPALARAYELPSISGSESVGIIRTLMLVEQPSAAVKQAVKDAVEYFVAAKLFDIKTEKTSNPTDVIVVASPGNVIWARFYDLETNLPFFCGRDGIKKSTLAEIEVERRTGYSWYGNWPSGIIGSEYTSWKSKHGL